MLVGLCFPFLYIKPSSSFSQGWLTDQLAPDKMKFLISTLLLAGISAPILAQFPSTPSGLTTVNSKINSRVKISYKEVRSLQGLPLSTDKDSRQRSVNALPVSNLTVASSIFPAASCLILAATISTATSSTSKPAKALPPLLLPST
jgi:uncharacterized lipoprotein YajG